MAVRIKFAPYDQEAVIEHYEWTAAPEELKALLDTYLDPFGPSPSDPYPEMTVAREVTSKIGGKIVYFDPPNYHDDEEGRIY